LTVGCTNKQAGVKKLEVDSPIIITDGSINLNPPFTGPDATVQTTGYQAVSVVMHGLALVDLRAAAPWTLYLYDADSNNGQPPAVSPVATISSQDGNRIDFNIPNFVNGVHKDSKKHLRSAVINVSGASPQVLQCPNKFQAPNCAVHIHYCDQGQCRDH